MPGFETNGISFVSLLGGLTRNFAANPHDVMHLLAEKTGARAYVLPVPFFANSARIARFFWLNAASKRCSGSPRMRS